VSRSPLRIRVLVLVFFAHDGEVGSVVQAIFGRRQPGLEDAGVGDYRFACRAAMEEYGVEARGGRKRFEAFGKVVETAHLDCGPFLELCVGIERFKEAGRVDSIE
jgi:hypothetical protein